jgi:probable phosphoglycerate mutase
MQPSILQTLPNCLDTEARSFPDFYFLRHGITDANLQGVTCGGGWDIGLNAAGLSQSFTVAQGALRKCPDLKTICCSPMKRATQTTNIVKAVLKLPVVVVEGLREIMVGEWERKPWHEMPDPFVALYDPPGGEAIATFEKRVAEAVAEACKNPGPVLIVSHGGVWLALARYLGIKQSWLDNCALHKVRRTESGKTWVAELVT